MTQHIACHNVIQTAYLKITRNTMLGIFWAIGFSPTAALSAETTSLGAVQLELMAHSSSLCSEIRLRGEINMLVRPLSALQWLE